MGTVVIRKAVEEDYEALCEIIDQVDRLHREELPRRFRPADGPVRTRDFILNAIDAPDVGLFVAELGDSLVGFVHVVVMETRDIPIFVPRRFAVVDGLAVKEAHRRTGIGRALMGEAEDWARAEGATSIELNVYTFNAPATGFYRGLGYDTLSQRMTKRLG